MTNKKQDFHFAIDWIGATFEPYFAKKFGYLVGLGAWASDVDTKGMHGYNVGKELETGLRVAWHTEDDRMGVHFAFSGACLRWYETKNMTGFNLLQLIKKHKGKVTRVDLAIDVENSQLTPKELCKENLKAYKGKGRTPKFITVLGDKGAWTVYVGSRQSEKYLRIYDKAKEQGDYESDRVRIELECKGDIAKAVGYEAPTHDEKWLVAMAQTLIRGQADFDLETWNAALSSVDVGIGIPRGRERDTFGWLTKVCAPALAKEIAKHPNARVLDEFWDALRSALREQGVDA